MQAERRVSCGAHSSTAASSTRNVTQLWHCMSPGLLSTILLSCWLPAHSCQPKCHPDCTSPCRVTCDHADQLSLEAVVEVCEAWKRAPARPRQQVKFETLRGKHFSNFRVAATMARLVLIALAIMAWCADGAPSKPNIIWIMAGPNGTRIRVAISHSLACLESLNLTLPVCHTHTHAPSCTCKLSRLLAKMTWVGASRGCTRPRHRMAGSLHPIWTSLGKRASSSPTLTLATLSVVSSFTFSSTSHSTCTGSTAHARSIEHPPHLLLAARQGGHPLQMTWCAHTTPTRLMLCVSLTFKSHPICCCTTGWAPSDLVCAHYTHAPSAVRVSHFQKSWHILRTRRMTSL
jgi:hypothetical protein